jgi:predicted kinase
MVILLVGPAGSGKTTLGRRIAEHARWVHISEDDIWDESGHPAHEPRTEQGQQLVHTRVHEQIGRSLNAGLNVILEFLVYENPPLRLTEYQNFLLSHGIPFVTRVLRPSVACILDRQRARGRSMDRNVEQGRCQAEHQLACLNVDLINPAWIIDSSEETLNETFSRHFRHLVETSSDVRIQTDLAPDVPSQNTIERSIQNPGR